MPPPVPLADAGRVLHIAEEMPLIAEERGVLERVLPLRAGVLPDIVAVLPDIAAVLPLQAAVLPDIVAVLPDNWRSGGVFARSRGNIKAKRRREPGVPTRPLTSLGNDWRKP